MTFSELDPKTVSNTELVSKNNFFDLNTFANCQKYSQLNVNIPLFR